MKKNLLLVLLISIINVNLFSQIGISVFVTPRIESEAIGANYFTPIYGTKVNTYATINGAYQKDMFFVELGFEFIRKLNQSLNESGTVQTGGGSGELNSYNTYRNHSFNYSNVQPKLNFGLSFEIGKHAILVGLGSQNEYLVGFNTNSFSSENNFSNDVPIIEAKPFEKPRKSFYLKVNPRLFITEKVFLEINNLFGVSKHQKSHLRKMSFYVENHSELRLFFETGLGIGINL